MSSYRIIKCLKSRKSLASPFGLLLKVTLLCNLCAMCNVQFMYVYHTCVSQICVTNVCVTN